MKIHLTRYYGDPSVTKSHMTIEGTTFHCETREPAYRDYTQSFPGASKFCLPRGTFRCKPMPTELSPLTLTVMKAPAHRSCRFVHDPFAQARHNSITLGQPINPADPPETREIDQSQETFLQLEQLIYRAYEAEEEITLSITNPDDTPHPNPDEPTGDTPSSPY